MGYLLSKLCYSVGTIVGLWSVIYNLLYCCKSLGNHEFDDGISGLLPFLENVTFPILSCNINAENEVEFQEKINRSTILIVNETKVGIVGYTLSSTPDFSNTGKLTFVDEVEAVQKEVNQLLARGVNIIVALGHSGIDVDIDLANRVEGLDIVIGGHTNTFLYTGSPPSDEKPYDVYPITVHPEYDTSRSVLVVSAFAYGKYLGRLDVTFSETGDVVAYTGNPILLDHTVDQDPTTASEVDNWAVKVNEVSTNVIGQTFVSLETYMCQFRECNYGNVITDAMVGEFLQAPDEQTWSNASIAIATAGSIQGNTLKPGQITVGDIRSTFPYGNTIDVIELKGKYLLQALEHSIRTKETNFLQVSGLLVTYDISRPEGDRVIDVQVRCSACTEPYYEDLEDEQVYKIVTNSYIAAGGNDYDMIKNNKLTQIKGRLDMDVLINYIGLKSPIWTGRESRITILSESSSRGAVTSLDKPVLCIVLVIISCNLLFS